MTTPILAEHHRKMLITDSAINPEIVTQRGYRTITDKTELRKLGFAISQSIVPTLLMPVWGTNGEIVSYQHRPDKPRELITTDKKTGERRSQVIKYESPAERRIFVDCPPLCTAKLASNPKHPDDPLTRPKLKDVGEPLYITEGIKKADSLASRGACAVALLGVWNFKNDGNALLPDFDDITLKNRQIYIVFDSDVMRKAPVQAALKRLTERLQQKGASVDAIYLPDSNGEKQGIDDFFAAGKSLDDLKSLAEAPREIPKPAPATFEIILDDLPTITRPLSLIKSRAYACAWPQGRREIKEKIGKDGEVIRFKEPSIEIVRELHVIADDGQTFGIGGDRPLDELKAEVKVNMPPPNVYSLDARGLQLYRQGERANPVELFNKAKAGIDYFVSFTSPLGAQDELSELGACIVFVSWLLPAFNVSPYIYWTGESGSGKTKAANTIVRMCHLGMTVTQNTTLPALRDTLILGGAIAADDVESLTSKDADVNLRAMLLASNRRGALVSLQQQTSAGKWEVNHLDVFGLKMFTAIAQPDATLGSRCITVLMSGSDDDIRANRNEQETDEWEKPLAVSLQGFHRQMWHMALANVSQLPRYDTLAGEISPISGRALDPWRALIAVAAWLDEKGVFGLKRRVLSMCERYQDIRFDTTTPDLTALIAHAIIRIASEKTDKGDRCDSSDSSDSNRGNPRIFDKNNTFTTQDIAEALPAVIDSLDIEFDTKTITPEKIGRRLRKLLPNGKQRRNKERYYIYTQADIKRIARTRNIKITSKPSHIPNTVTPVTTVTTVTEEDQPPPISSPTILTEPQQKYLSDIKSKPMAKLTIAQVKEFFGLTAEQFVTLFDRSEHKSGIKSNAEGSYVVINRIK